MIGQRGLRRTRGVGWMWPRRRDDPLDAMSRPRGRLSRRAPTGRPGRATDLAWICGCAPTPPRTTDGSEFRRRHSPNDPVVASRFRARLPGVWERPGKGGADALANHCDGLPARAARQEMIAFARKNSVEKRGVPPHSILHPSPVLSTRARIAALRRAQLTCREARANPLTRRTTPPRSRALR
jgi:hypothetical protein